MSSQSSLSAAAPPAVVATDENSSGDDSVTINSPNRWFFDKEKLESTPSRKCGIDSDKELTYRQQSANFIQDIGQRLQVNQLCINTAIVYMHRFYMFHSFSHFHRNAVSTASIFLAAKVEEQPRKLEHVIKVAHYCLHRDTQPQIDIKSEQYLEQSSELVMNENVLLQTLGFDVAIDHPHTHVVKCCQLVRASKDLAQTSYFMATNSLHLTTMCLQYKPTVVACVCIHLACKWSNWEIPRSKEGKDWFWYVDDTVTTEQLETMTTEFLTIFNKSPSRLKKKMMSLNQVSGAANLSLSSFPTHMSLDPTSPGAPNFPKSRSPSPAGSSKRLVPIKPSGSQQILQSKAGKPHGNMPGGHHGMKPHGGHHGPPPGSGANKHVHPTTGKPYHHPHGFPLHGSKDSHQQGSQPLKEGHPSQSLHGKHPNAPHHPPGIPPPYPHSGRPNAQVHHGQTHTGQKLLPPGSHPPHGGYSSKIPPPNPSKPPHNMNMQKPNAPGSTANKLPIPSHSQSTIKKPYMEGYGPKDDMMNRRGNPNPHPPQSRPRPSDKPDMRHHPPTGGGSQLPNSAHPPPHGADHSRSWTEHPSSGFGSSGDGSSNRPEKQNPAMASKNALPSDYYHRHPEKRISGSGGPVPNSLGSSSIGNLVDRNDNLNTPKVENMEDQFNQIVSKANANNSYYSSHHIAGGSLSGDASAPYKNKQGLYPTSSGAADLSGLVKTEEDGNQISPPLNAIPDNKSKRRHTEGLMDIRNPTSSKRPRSDAHAPLGSNLMPMSDELDGKKGMNSKSSPPHLGSRDSRRANNMSAFPKGPHLPEAITPFGNDLKSDMKQLNLPSSLSMELQPPELIEPFGENQAVNSLTGKSQSSSRGSIFSPKLSDPPLSSSIKSEGVAGNSKSASSSLKSANNSSYFSSSGVSLNSSNSGSMNSNSGHNGAQGIGSNVSTAHLSDTSISGSGALPDAPVPILSKPLSNETGSEHHKKSKKSKKEKHKHKDKHKDKEEKKHKKDKHREKDREKHKSRDKRRSSDALPADPVEAKPVKPIKISIAGVDKHGKDKESKSKHSSSKRGSDEHEDSRKVSSAPVKPTASLKVKIVNKERVRSLDEEPGKVKGNKMDEQNQHSQGQSTPCCPGFGPCTNPNCNQSQPVLKMKIPREKITGVSTSRPKESKETKKSKKEPKLKDKGSVSNSVVASKTSAGRISQVTSNHGHKNGVEKVTRKRESSSNL